MQTYYGFIDEIWELEYRENLKVPLFRCQWIRFPNGVKTGKYGMTNVNFWFLGYREQPFVLTKDVRQVFYVKDPDPANKEEHHIILQGKRKIVSIEDVVDEEEYNQFDALPPFGEDITIPTIDDPGNLRTYDVITMKLSLLDEAIWATFDELVVCVIIVVFCLIIHKNYFVYAYQLLN
jgi:hypothetical protein